MKTIGITGGGSIFALGPASEIRLFFDCIQTYVLPRYPKEDWSVLTDRLYKRYLRLEELDDACQKMQKVEETFATLKNDAIDWADYKVNRDESRINPDGETLADVFAEYFRGFSHCVEAAKISYYGFDDMPGYGYQAVLLIMAEVPWCIIEQQRPLSEYDNLNGDPFWFVK